MTITCPSCARKFSLADEALTSPFQKMKCSKCGHVFVFRKEEGERSQQEPTEKVESFTPVEAPEPELEAEGNRANVKVQSSWSSCW